jgi:hypothetical protein
MPGGFVFPDMAFPDLVSEAANRPIRRNTDEAGECLFQAVCRDALY